jgi:hypothetical protein
MGQTPGGNVAAHPEPTREPESSHDTAPIAEAVSTLSVRDANMLAFERQFTGHSGAKEHAIRSEFGLSPARYYQVLNALIDSPAAVRHDPMLVGRLQRARDARTQARAERAFATSDRGGRDPRHTQESTD